MKKTIMAALLIALSTAGMYSVMAEDVNATVNPSSSNGNAVDEGNTACCDGEGSTVCPIGNGVCDCLAHEIKDPLGNGKCYSCDGSSCNSGELYHVFGEYDLFVIMKAEGISKLNN